MDFINEGVHLPSSLRPFDCSANDVIHLKFIRSEKDVENDQMNFSPSFTHQLFGENERIFGYKNLQINLYSLSSSLEFYLNIQYDEEINPKKYQQFKADDIEQSLKEWLPPKTMRNLDQFLLKLKDEKRFERFGEEIFRYSLKNGNETKNYSINYVSNELIDNEEFRQWYIRFETFLVFFVDAASRIDKEDSNWRIYLLYEEYFNQTNDICFAPIGFITLYLYYAYPDQQRPRISQVLILPPYQRQGHGRQLLTTIYNHLRTNSRVQDITAEDPSEEFVALRDLVSFELVQKYLPEIFSKENILQHDKCTKEVYEKARSICKLTKQQTRRVFELSYLYGINRNNQEQLKRFRLLVKKRLFEPLQFNKRRCLQLSDPTLEALATDPEKRKSYLATQYDLVYEYYSNILQSFDKYHQ